MASPRKFACVVAVANNGGIGKNNSLPWKLHGDMKFFSHLTSEVSKEGTLTGKQNAVIMGRKTWESIPEKYRPLPHRLNILLSKNLSTAPKGAHHLCSSLQAAFDLLSTAPVADSVEKIFVIGGAAVYKVIAVSVAGSDKEYYSPLSAGMGCLFSAREALQHPGAHRLYITHVLKDFDCDVHFPDFDKNIFKEISDPEVSSEMQEEDGIQYKFQVYQRDI